MLSVLTMGTYEGTLLQPLSHQSAHLVTAPLTLREPLPRTASTPRTTDQTALQIPISRFAAGFTHPTLRDSRIQLFCCNLGNNMLLFQVERFSVIHFTGIRRDAEKRSFLW